MQSIKKDFPILNQMIHGKPLVYLDSSASSQKPNCVLEAITQYYQHNHANIHRGVHELSVRATHEFETTRETVQKFMGATHAHEIIFVSGTTHGINLVAQSYGRSHFKTGDEIIISAMEHHSNIVPWQMIAEQVGANLKIIPVNDAGELDMVAYEKLFSSRTKLVAITHASNVLGTLNPIKEMTRIAHANQAVVLVDGAQAIAHIPVDVTELDCDFYVFSAHKAYGPTGVGILYGKEQLLEQMPPYQGGGDMVERVTFAKTTYNKLPYKFEAGTPNIADVIGFKNAIHYLQKIGLHHVAAHEAQLLAHATEKLIDVPHLKIIGTASQKLGVLSFVLENIHPHDVGTILDHQGIAVRAGHHCAMPLMERFGIPGCTRASFAIYNALDDIDALVNGIMTVKKFFKQ